jgi:hypothetical protein
MTFKHKLSCRLAIMRDALSLLAFGVALASCEVPAAGPGDPVHSVVQVIVAPESLSLDPTQQVKFAAYGRTASGDSSAVTVNWSATGGSITPDGMFVADTAGGDFLVSGTSAALKLSASARVHIRPRPVPGGTVLFQEHFEDNAFTSRGWYDNTSLVTTSAQHTPGSTRALEFHFVAGSSTPTSGGSTRHLFPATATVYISYWVKYSANWVGSAHLYHPHEFMVMSDLDGDYDGPSNSWLAAYVEHNYQNGGIPHLALQDGKAINTSFGTPPINLSGVTETRSTCGCNGVVESNVATSCFSFPPWYNAKELIASQVWFQPNPGPGYKGDWNHVEAYFQINSVVGGIGVPDGVMQYWFNGTLVIDRHDILLRTGARPTIKFHQFLMTPYIGDGSPVDQYMWVDDLTVATARP